MENIKDKSERLWQLRQILGEKEKAYKEVTDPLKAERDNLQLEVMQSFKELGTATMRYSFATVSLAIRRTPRIEDENKIIAWLKKKKLSKEYTAVRLTEQFDALAKESVKRGEVIDGLIVNETEFLSITTATKEDRRKEVIN